MSAEEHFKLVESSSHPKYNVGDLVCTKFTGFPGVAKIIGILPAITYCNMMNKYNYALWDDLFENWKFEPIYILLFDEPRKSTRFEEHIRELTDEQKSWYKDGALEQIYELTVPQTRCLLYPEQDLELFQ